MLYIVFIEVDHSYLFRDFSLIKPYHPTTDSHLISCFVPTMSKFFKKKTLCSAGLLPAPASCRNIIKAIPRIRILGKTIMGSFRRYSM